MWISYYVKTMPDDAQTNPALLYPHLQMKTQKDLQEYSLPSILLLKMPSTGSFSPDLLQMFDSLGLNKKPSLQKGLASELNIFTGNAGYLFRFHLQVNRFPFLVGKTYCLLAVTRKMHLLLN